MDPTTYRAARDALLKDNARDLIELEKQVTFALLQGLFDYAGAIKADFDLAMDLRIFWELYAPLPRGRKPRGAAYPWGEVGEKVVEAHLYSMLDQIFNAKTLRFPGIPYGHDVRFLTDSAFVQIDVKSTGPTDDLDEVVVSPNQVTGDGQFNKGLVTNNTQKVKGPKTTFQFRPELSPFVSIGRIYPVLTYCIKTVYSVPKKGEQPLDYLELACVPNGLLMFDGPKYHKWPALLSSGKSDKKEVARNKRRMRIHLGPLSQIDNWRCVKLAPGTGGVWSLTYRANNQPVVLPAKTGGSSAPPAPS